VARQLGIQHACCGQDKADCLRRIASEIQTPGGRIYIADLQSDFDAARAAGWDWANINDLCLNIGSGLTKFDGWGTELEFVIMVIAVSCVKLLSAHNSTQHTSRKHKV
jgi:hypothetical protein